MPQPQSPVRFVPLVAVVAIVCLASPPPASPGDGANANASTPIVVRVDSGGFHWSDAGVGVLLGGGAVIAVSGGLLLLRAGEPNNRDAEKGVRR